MRCAEADDSRCRKYRRQRCKPARSGHALRGWATSILQTHSTPTAKPCPRCAAGAISHTYHGPREAVRVNILDAACTLGLWLLNTLSVVASFEVTKFTASLSPYNDGVGTRYVVLSTVALIAWALSTSLLLPIFKRVFAGGFDRTSPRGGA